MPAALNNDANPAAKGSIISLFGDGAGALTSGGVDGLVARGPDLPRVALPVSVQIGDIQAEVTFAGAASGFVEGVTRIDVRIPPGAPSGQVPVVLRIGDFATQPNVTVAIQ